MCDGESILHQLETMEIPKRTCSLAGDRSSAVGAEPPGEFEPCVIEGKTRDLRVTWCPNSDPAKAGEIGPFQ